MPTVSHPRFKKLSQTSSLAKIPVFFFILLIASPVFAQFLVGKINPPTGSDLWDIQVYEAGEKLFVHEYTTNSILVYNSRTLAFLGNLSFPAYSPYIPNDIVIAEEQGLLYVNMQEDGNSLDSMILVVNADTLALETATPVAATGGMTVDVKHNRLYLNIMFGYNNKLTVLDLTTLALIGVVDIHALMGEGLVGGYSLNMETGEWVYPNLHYDKFVIVNGSTLTGELISAPGSRGWGGTWNSLENKIYITTAAWNGYFIYDRDTGAYSTTPCVNDGTSLFFNPATNRVYTSAEINKDTTVINGTTDACQNVEMPVGALVTVGFLKDRNHAVFAGIHQGVYFLDEGTLKVAKSFPDITEGGCYEMAVDQLHQRIFAKYDNSPDTDYILVFDDPIPALTLTSPNGGESWGVGSSSDITWTNSGSVANVKIEYSTDNGVTWTTITASTPNTGSFSWTVPNTPSSSCLVKVMNADSAYMNGDESDGVFSIDDITIGEAVDNTGLDWKTGGNGAWGGENTVYFNGGDAAQSGPLPLYESNFIQTTMTGPGAISFYWKVSSWNNLLSFFVDETKQAEISGEIDWERNICSIPAGAHTLTWVYRRSSPVDLGSNCGWVDLVEYTPGGFFISGTVIDALGGGFANVAMIGLPGNPVTSASGLYWSVVPSGWAGTVTPTLSGYNFVPASISYTNIMSDQIGQNYKAAPTFTISGTLTLNGSPLAGVVMNGLPGNPATNSAGTYSALVNSGWGGTVIPTLAGYGFTPSSRVYADTTYDHRFENYTATATALMVLSPNGGESWESGSAHNITWTTTGIVANVKIEYSSDGGTNWTTIIASTANVNSYAWNLPDIVSANCLIKVSEASGGIPYDVSNAVFAIIAGAPSIGLSKTSFNFGTVKNGTPTPAEYAVISNTGGGTLNWTAAPSVAWLGVTPGSGAGAGSLMISIVNTNLIPGTYLGTITILAPNATNSPQTITINLNVKAAGADSPPFGNFATPTDGATVASSIPVTGWALDDIGLKSVKIYRGTGVSNRIYIGDAMFVEGARPDVKIAYSTYPQNSKAGWGYMLLTNFLPNGGNGTFTLLAYAKDTADHEVLLGTKTITCDNLHAVKPFGAIDTPTQGGAASGAAYVNFGWALTPQPNSIATNGSTIWVYVDGVALTHPTYNNYRKDIATFFPGYANSNAAVGYFYLDTTGYADGVHTIAWSVADTGGNTDGIGSRYFTIQNAAGGAGVNGSDATSSSSSAQQNTGIRSAAEIAGIPEDGRTPIYVKRGWGDDLQAETVFPETDGFIRISIPEVSRLAVYLNEESANETKTARAERGRRVLNKTGSVRAGYDAYELVGDALLPLPIGASFDSRDGIFFWHPGPGFLGEYQFVVVDSAMMTKRTIKITIVPDKDSNK